MSNETCPYCKAEKKYENSARMEFKCGSAYFCDGSFVRDYVCYESQIAAQAAEIERLKKDATYWKKMAYAEDSSSEGEVK